MAVASAMESKAGCRQHSKIIILVNKETGAKHRQYPHTWAYAGQKIMCNVEVCEFFLCLLKVARNSVFKTLVGVN